jgi:hypothetical protein
MAGRTERPCPSPGCHPEHDWPPVDGCRHCGHHWHGHNTRYSADATVGAHVWTEPTAQQRADRAAAHTRK